jgi:ATP synthase protein I
VSGAETPPEEHDPLVAGIRLRSERRARWLRDGEDSVSRRLAQIGVLGWITVIPMLVGIFAGRWLDRMYHTGIFWTAPLLMLGAAIGCWSAWRWIGSA